MSATMQPTDKPVALARLNVPLVVVAGSVTAIIITVASWTWIAATQFSGLRQQVQESRADLRTQMVSLKSDLQTQIQSLSNRFDLMDFKMSDRWTRTDMRKYTSDMARRNPSINVPDIDK